MPREGYINLTLRKSVRNRLARVARIEDRTMTEELEHMLQKTEVALGLKTEKAGKQPARGKKSGKPKKSGTPVRKGR